MRQNQGNYRLSQHLWCHFLDLIWLKQPRHNPCKEEPKAALHEHNPTPWKLPLWKLNVKKTQCRGNDKKHNTGNWDMEKLTQQKAHKTQSRFQKISGLGRRSSLLWLEGHMPNKILFPLQSFISCFFEPPMNRQVEVDATEGLWRGYSSVCPKAPLSPAL